MSGMRASCLVPLDIIFLEKCSHISCEMQPACSAALPAATERRRRMGGRQGTASLLGLPWILFNCLLIYLMMAATRTCGQAASMLSLKQFTALKSILLDNPPSLMSINQSSPIFSCVPIRKQQDATADWSHLAPRQTEAGSLEHKGFARGLRLKKHLQVDWSSDPWHVSLPTGSALTHSSSPVHTD